jgi:DNA-binding response OmpR family regulator
MAKEGKSRDELVEELNSCHRRLKQMEGLMEDKADTELNGSETILLVEDDDHVRGSVRRILEHYGYQVLEAYDAQSALGLVQQNAVTYDLVLTDIMMPGLSGRDLVERLQALKPKVKVLFMSGYADGELIPDDVFDVLDSGQNFLEKPFTPEILATKIRHVLDAADKTD